MNSKELLEKLNKYPAVEPDEWEKEAIAVAKSRTDDEDLVSFDELKAKTSRANGKVSLRIPRQLHIDLINDAEEQGVSLNQYISFILASRAR